MATSAVNSGMGMGGGSTDDCSSLSSAASSGRSRSSGSLGFDTPPASPTVNGHPFPKKRQRAGPKYKLMQEGDIQLCRLNHTRTIVSKIMNSKYLRRWESHHLVLGSCDIQSATVRCFGEIFPGFNNMIHNFTCCREC